MFKIPTINPADHNRRRIIKVDEDRDLQRDFILKT